MSRRQSLKIMSRLSGVLASFFGCFDNFSPVRLVKKSTESSGKTLASVITKKKHRSHVKNLTADTNNTLL